MGLLRELTNFANETSIHGVKYISSASSLSRRVIWALLFLGSLIFEPTCNLFFWNIQLLGQFRQFAVSDDILTETKIICQSGICTEESAS